MRKHRLISLIAVGAIAALGLVLPGTAANAAAPLQVTTTTLPSQIYTGTKYPTTNLKASGGTSFLGTYKWAVAAGRLPGGVKLSAGGQLSGRTDTILLGNGSNPPGVYPFTVQVTDSKNVVATKDFVIVVKRADITTTSLPNAKKGQLYYSQLKIAGGCSQGVSWKWRANPAQPLPPGLKISTQGAISGSAKTVGVYTVAIEATCGGTIPFLTAYDAKTFTLTVV